MAPIRLGILGAGIMGERLLRAALEHASESVQVSGIWDPSEAALSRIGSALGAAGGKCGSGSGWL